MEARQYDGFARLLSFMYMPLDHGIRFLKPLAIDDLGGRAPRQRDSLRVDVMAEL